jgi:putative ABC transport system permease protein
MDEAEEIDGIVVFQAALSARTADVFGLEVGSTAVLRTDPGDPMVGRAPPRYAAIEVTGIYEVPEPAAEWWLADRYLVEPVVRQLGGDIRFYDAAALLADEAYPAFMASTAEDHPPVRYTWRRFVDPARLDASTVEPLLVDLRRAQTTFPTANPTPAYETGYRTGLLPLIEGQQARWAAATAILTVLAIGPAAVAAAAVALVAVLAAQRRRAALSVSRSRGASVGQLVAAVVLEGLLLTVPAVAVAILLAQLAIPAGPGMQTVVVATSVAVATVLILVATSVPAASSEARGGRDTGIVRPPTPRRLVGEALLVGLALGGAWLLRERGVRGSSSAGTLETADPLIAAVPALVGLAAGVLAVRLVPIPMRFLAWLARGRRDLVPVLAMRRATSGTGVGPILVVLLATATIGAFASAALVHLERGTEAVAWQETGAAYRITVPSGPLPATIEPESLPGVEASATVFRTAVPVGLSGPRTNLLIVDVPGIEAVTAGTPADPVLPEAVRGTPGAPEPIPAVISRSLGQRADGVDPGERFELSVEGYTLEYEAIDVRDSFPGVEPGNHFVVVSREHIRTAAPTARMDPTAMLLRAPDDRVGDLRAAVSEVVAGGTLHARAERTAELRGSPVAVAVRAGIAGAALVSALYAALAVAAALALAGLARAVEVAHLRTLGLSRRQALGLVVMEHGPTVIAAFAIGVGLGLALFNGLRPGLGLAALVGSNLEVPLAVDPVQLLLVLLGIVGIVVFGMAVGAALQRAAVPATAVRRGFE